jgi:hypothetical protein
MSLIYNKCLSLYTGLNSVALNATGDLAAVCFNDREIIGYRVNAGSREIDPSQIVNPKIGALEDESSLEEYRFHRLLPGRYNRPPEAEVYFRDTKLAFLDDEILLVARGIEQIGGGSSTPPGELAHVSLAAVKIETGEVVAEFTDPEYGPIFSAPLLIPPKYVLFPAGNTAICLDTTSFHEVFRLREFDEKGAVKGEEGSSGGEQICPNAVAYDPGTGILYVLWREFVSSFLQTYRLHPEKGSFERLQRRAVLEGLDGNSLCLRPDGREVAVWATAMDEVIDCRTEQNFQMPETVRLGRLGVFSPEGDRFFDVDSKVELYRVEGRRNPQPAGSEAKAADAAEPKLLWAKCDFIFLLHYRYDPDGGATEVGIRYGVDYYASKPFYVDDRTVVINTPGGTLVGVDTVSGKSEPLMETSAPIEDLCVHPQKRLLLVGTKGSVQIRSGLTLLGLA